MYRTLFSIGNYNIGTYFVLLVMAFIIATFMSIKKANKLDNDIYISPWLGIWIFFWAMLGSHLYWILEYVSGVNDIKLADILKFWHSGHVFYGGFCGGLLSIYLYSVFMKISFLPLLDLLAPFLALGYSITRIGCFFNGCCYGSISEAPWAIRFPRFHGGPYLAQLRAGEISFLDKWSLPVHPTQIYSAIAAFLIYLFLRHFYRKKQYGGQITLYFIFIYGIVRFTIELFRADCPRYTCLNITLAQIISIGLIIFSLILFALHRIMNSALFSRLYINMEKST